MCKRCVFLEGREDLINNAGSTFANDVAGTEHLTVVAIIVDVDANTLKYVCFDNTALKEDMEGDTIVPHFVYKLNLPDKGNFVSPLAVRQAIDAGSIEPDMDTPLKAFEYINKHKEEEPYIVGMASPRNPLAVLGALLQHILED